MYYGARFYDPSLGRFASADSIVPAGVQGYDRYAYVNNNPLKYTDPSGHMAEDDDNGGSGCSVSAGVFNGNYGCTADDFNNATIQQRQGYFKDMLG